MIEERFDATNNNLHRKKRFSLLPPSRLIRSIAAFISATLIGISGACGTSDVEGSDPLLSRSYNVNNIKKMRK